jgi:hypothetical protein
VLEGPSATNLLYYFFYFAALYHFINKKIKILNVGNFVKKINLKRQIFFIFAFSQIAQKTLENLLPEKSKSQNEN